LIACLEPHVHPDGAHDFALFESLQRGNDAALTQIIERWEQPLFAFAWRYTRNQADAQDLAAETFVRLYQQRARLRPDTKLSAWLFTTLTNLCHNQHRWRRRHPALSLDASDENENSEFEALVSDAPVPGAGLAREEAIAALTGAINELPHDLKVTVMLHYHEQLSYREIAAILGCSERGVETRLYRARQQLRHRLVGTFTPAG
jgi:RNA polymerase sigma-70 factor (ECF subfamily)